MNSKLSHFSKTAGSGILFACTALGVSHLIQSTRAGADFGLMILGFVVLATVLSFVIAPIIAIFNFRLVTGKYLPQEHHPNSVLKVLSFAGIVFLTGFAIFFLVTKFFS